MKLFSQDVAHILGFVRFLHNKPDYNPIGHSEMVKVGNFHPICGLSLRIAKKLRSYSLDMVELMQMNYSC